MNRTASLAALALLAAAGAARADDVADVRAVLGAEVRLFATYDATLAGSVYASDVIWQNPFGVRIRSEAELRAFLARPHGLGPISQLHI